MDSHRKYKCCGQTPSGETFMFFCWIPAKYSAEDIEDFIWEFGNEFAYENMGVPMEEILDWECME